MIMKNNSNLKSLVLNNVLTLCEMKLVKGGVNANANANALANAVSALTVNGPVALEVVTSTAADDKRRERPGGGITSL
jgi:hypothetical protein